jgi:hypothetical protein
MDDLETIIRDLIERKNALPEDSPEHRFVVRQLVGLRYSREEAGGIIEDLDPMGWGSYARPLKNKKQTGPKVDCSSSQAVHLDDRGDTSLLTSPPHGTQEG